MLRLIAFIVCMVLGFGAAIRSRFSALLFYLWFALFRPQEWVWTDIAGLRLSLILGLVLVVPSVLSGILPNVSHPLAAGSLLFLGTALVAQTNAIRPDIGWIWIDFLGRLLLVSLLAVTLITSLKRLFWVVLTMAVSLGFHTAKAGLASIMGGGVRFSDGLAGAFVDNNGYALGTVMILPLLMAAAQNVPREYPGARFLSVGLYLAVPLSMLTVVSTFSRGGMLGLAVALLTFVLLQRRKLVALAVCAGFVALAYLVVPIPAGYFDRIQTIRTYDEIQEDSALGRLHFWRVAIAMARANPLGVGLRNYESQYDRYDSLNGRFGVRRSVHSSHFQVLAENGFAGLGVWMALFGIAVWKAWSVRLRSRNPALHPVDARFLMTVANALIVSMSGFLVGGAFIALSLNDLTWLTFGLVAALDRISRQLPCGKSDVEGINAAQFAGA